MKYLHVEVTIGDDENPSDRAKLVRDAPESLDEFLKKVSQGVTELIDQHDVRALGSNLDQWPWPWPQRPVCSPPD